MSGIECYTLNNIKYMCINFLRILRKAKCILLALKMM